MVATLASCEDISAKIVLAHKRLKAAKVGDIRLNYDEVAQLKEEGDRFVGQMARMLGVEVRDGGGFSSALPGSDVGLGNYVGK